jgi:hypothetical protein
MHCGQIHAANKYALQTHTRCKQIHQDSGDWSMRSMRAFMSEVLSTCLKVAHHQPRPPPLISHSPPPHPSNSPPLPLPIFQLWYSDTGSATVVAISYFGLSFLFAIARLCTSKLQAALKQLCACGKSSGGTDDDKPVTPDSKLLGGASKSKEKKPSKKSKDKKPVDLKTGLINTEVRWTARSINTRMNDARTHHSSEQKTN